jgi:prepilin-type N-terminal cleavage/methylation domain-containing protein
MPMIGARRAFTLMELVVALTITGVVFAGVVRLSVNHQRLHRDLSLGASRFDQLGQTTALLPVALRGVAPGEGDILAGSAVDTALQFRATTVASVICDTAGNTVTLAPAAVAKPVLTSILDAPAPGDSLWALAVSDSGERWVPARIIGVGSGAAGGCRLGGIDVVAAPAARVRLTLATAVGEIGAPVRVTRWARYSVYRSSDGDWYLGYRDWNDALGRFNTIQPVSGPFRRSGAAGLRLTFADSSGIVVPSGSAATANIARIDIAVVSDTTGSSPSRMLGVRASAALAIGVRNR